MRTAGGRGGRFAAAPAVLAVCALGLGLGACGSGGGSGRGSGGGSGSSRGGSGGSGGGAKATAPTVKVPCQAAPRAMVARLLGIGVGRVSAVSSTGSNGSPQCTYRAGRRSVVANIDVTSQAYFIVERTAVEASQQFAPIPQAKLPVQVSGIGLDAYWYPAFSQFETTDGVRVIQVTVTLPGARQAREIAAGKAVARPYLGKLHPPP